VLWNPILTDGILVISFQVTAVQTGKRSRIFAFLVRFLSQNNSDGFDHDFQVQPQRPISDVAMIQLDPGSHFLDRVGLKPAAENLGQSGNPRLDLVPEHVTSNQAAELLVVGYGIRPWANE